MNSRQRSHCEIKDVVGWDEVDDWLWDVFLFLDGKTHNLKYIYGIPRGGLIPAVWLSHHLNLSLRTKLTDVEIRGGFVSSDTLIVDDVVSTGKSIKGFNPGNVVSLVRNPWSPEILFAAKETDHWVVLPWENQ